MATQKAHLDGFAMILLVGLCASWGLQQVAIKVAATEISPILQSCFRSFGATVFVFLWVCWRKKPIFQRDGTLWWGLLAGTLFSVEFLLLYWGLEFTDASRAIIFLYLSPFVVAIGTQIFVPSEKLTLLQVVGLGCSFFGICIAFGESITLPSEEKVLGDAMLILAAIFWGATTVVIKASPLAVIAPSKTLLYQLAVSTVLLPFGLLVVDTPQLQTPSPLTFVSLLYQTIWIATVTYLAWFWLIRHYPAPRLASFSFLAPFFGVFAGIILLDEPMTAALFVAMIFVALGIYLVNRTPSSSPKKEEVTSKTS